MIKPARMNAFKWKYVAPKSAESARSARNKIETKTMATQFNPVTINQLLDAPVRKVWDALTLHDQMIRWFFENIPEFEPEVGFQTRFPVYSGERIFTHVWKILEVVPLKKILYQWSYTEYPGESKVTFELTDQENQTRLIVRHEGLESFSQEIPEFSRENCRAGWTFFIQERLPLFLEE
jgi:uncharacterized protein YndB with AHSA1/START domain